MSPSWTAGSKPFKPLLAQEKKTKKNGSMSVRKSEYERLQLEEWLRPAMVSCAAQVKKRVSAEVVRSKVKESVEERNEKSSDKSIDKSSEKSNDKSIDKSIDEAINKSNIEPINNQSIKQEPATPTVKETTNSPNHNPTHPVAPKTMQQTSGEPEKKQTSSAQRKESLKARLKKNPLLRFMFLLCLQKTLTTLCESTNKHTH